MKPLTFLLLPVIIVLAGCGHKETASDNHEQGNGAGEHTPEVTVSFKAKSGLLVPAGTARFIGLQIVDVQERKVASQFRFTAQVYRSGATAGASGLLSEPETACLRPDQTVQVETDSGPPRSGRIVAVHRELEKTGGLVEVQLEIADTARTLSIGSLVTATVPTGKGEAVVSVPRSALLQTAEGNFVYTVSGERFVRAAVKVGVVNDDFVEITDGLYAGDQVAAQPVMTLWMAELQSIRGGKACADGH